MPSIRRLPRSDCCGAHVQFAERVCSTYVIHSPSNFWRSVSSFRISFCTLRMICAPGMVESLKFSAISMTDDSFWPLPRLPV